MNGERGGVDGRVKEKWGEGTGEQWGKLHLGCKIKKTIKKKFYFTYNHVMSVFMLLGLVHGHVHAGVWGGQRHRLIVTGITVCCQSLD